VWALPTMKQLNQEAETKTFQDRLRRALKTGKLNGEVLTCEWAEHDDPSRCDGELGHYLHYDIFSDKPKGILTLCEHHDGYYGSPSEGYFTCEDCQRVHTENITWERYVHDTEDGPVCLPCYAKRVIADDDQWIPLTGERINALTERDLHKAPHCIGVQMPIPAGIEFVNNVEYDSYSGRGISGGGVEELKDTLNKLKAEGEDRALLILDAAFQFAVSVGLYRETAEARDHRRKVAA
jgi:hypothetical protein